MSKRVKTIKINSSSEIKAGDYIQEKNHRVPLKVYLDKSIGLLGVSMKEAWGVTSGQTYIYLNQLKLEEYFEKVIFE